MPQPKYQRLGFNEREEISRGLAAGESMRDIGKRITHTVSSISREVNSAGMCSSTYRAERGQKRADAQCHTNRRVRKLTEESLLLDYIYKKLRLDWSPQEIAARLKKEYPLDMNMRISHETIYTHLYCLPKGELKKELMRHLRHERTLRNNRKNSHDKRGEIPDMVSIEDRPESVTDRVIPGHWEGDLILGAAHTSALGTLVERTSRTVLLVPLTHKDAASVRIAFAGSISHLPDELKMSLTYDRVKEMTEHKRFTIDTNIQVYFAHPHSPWERGTNENTNGLIRQYFPKGTDFTTISKDRIEEVQNLLNTRPRKVLDYFTPQEKMKSLLTHQPVALEV